MRETLWVALGGAIGTTARYWIALWALPISRQLPLGTILINIFGSCAIGFFGTLTLPSGRYPASEMTRLFFMVGICGGFTTFSSFSLQTLDLIRADAFNRAMLNIAVSVILCLIAVSIGHGLASRFNGGLASIAATETEEEAG